MSGSTSSQDAQVARRQLLSCVEVLIRSPFVGPFTLLRCPFPCPPSPLSLCSRMTRCVCLTAGKHQLTSNSGVVDVVRTTLDPQGMDKLVHDDNRTTISNDGATIMKPLDIVHPAAKFLVDFAKSQDSEGKDQLISNSDVVDVVRTTLDPRGMDKLVHDDKGTMNSNDGATIMKLDDIVHPVAKILVDIAKSWAPQIGDGTLVVLAGERQAKPIIDEVVHWRLTLRAFLEGGPGSNGSG